MAVPTFESFDNSDSNNSGQRYGDVMPNIRYFNKEKQVDHVTAGWKYYDRQAKTSVPSAEPLVVHIRPAIRDGKLLPYRHGSEPDSSTFNQWGMKLDVTDFVGSSPKFMDRLNWIINHEGREYRKFIRRISTASNSNTVVGHNNERVDCTSWFTHDKKLAGMRYPSPIYFLSVGVILNSKGCQLNDKNQPLGYGKGDFAQILTTTKTCGKQLEDMLNAQSENYDPFEGSVNDNFALGDVTELGPNGKFMIIWKQPEKDGTIRHNIFDVMMEDPTDVKSRPVTQENNGQYKLAFANEVWLPMDGTSRRKKYTISDMATEEVIANVKSQEPLNQFLDVPTLSEQEGYLAQCWSKTEDGMGRLSYGFSDSETFWVNPLVKAALMEETGSAIGEGNVQEAPAETAQASPYAAVPDSSLSTESLAGPSATAVATSTKVRKIRCKACSKILKVSYEGGVVQCECGHKMKVPAKKLT